MGFVRLFCRACCTSDADSKLQEPSVDLYNTAISSSPFSYFSIVDRTPPRNLPWISSPTIASTSSDASQGARNPPKPQHPHHRPPSSARQSTLPPASSPSVTTHPRPPQPTRPSARNQIAASTAQASAPPISRRRCGPAYQNGALVDEIPRTQCRLSYRVAGRDRR
jgi:hypothetical protein